MRNLFFFLNTPLIVLLLLAPVTNASDRAKDDDRLRNSGTVLKEILDIPDNTPQDLLDKADCVAFPSVLKAAFVVGGGYRRDAVSRRESENFREHWGAPTMLALKSGRFVFQIGGGATDFVLLLMNECAANAILAGPVGRDTSAETDATLRAEILSYSRARGLFAGISLEGSTVRLDNGGNHHLYGREIPAKRIVLSRTVPARPLVRRLISTLEAKTPTHRV
jgi:lipid-binding SYLF domain-containing protein